MVPTYLLAGIPTVAQSEQQFSSPEWVHLVAAAGERRRRRRGYPARLRWLKALASQQGRRAGVDAGQPAWSR